MQGKSTVDVTDRRRYRRIGVEDGEFDVEITSVEETGRRRSTKLTDTARLENWCSGQKMGSTRNPKSTDLSL